MVEPEIVGADNEFKFAGGRLVDVALLAVVSDLGDGTASVWC